ncbi:MAG: ion transporter [Saprospiraceae bacterium]
MFKRFFLVERNVLLAIIVNAIIICWMYFPTFRHHAWLELADHFFLIFFIIEAVIKIRVLGGKNYFSNRWNQFDFFIVLGSLPSLLTSIILVPNTSLLMILRLFRLFRLIRFIRFVPHMGQILAGLTRALRASVFVLLALVFLNFMLAIISCHFFAGVAPEFFGDPLVSAYSIFQMFTVEGWNEIPKVIAENSGNEISPFLLGMMRFYFVLVVLLGGIFGMSLANAVFVDEMTMDNNKVLEDKIDQLQEQILELKELLKNT